MKITIKTQKTRRTIMELFLEYYKGTGVILKGYDQDGITWNILDINEEGVRLHKNIGARGWPLDKEQKIKTRTPY